MDASGKEFQSLCLRQQAILCRIPLIMTTKSSASDKNRTQADDPLAAPPRVGQEIQRLRIERKLTLEDLSKASGVSKSMLSEIERNRANPTIALVWRLTNALGVSLDDLFMHHKSQHVIRVQTADESPVLHSESDGYQLQVWGPIELAGRFEWYELRLQPGGALVSEPHEPGTVEHMTVMQGELTVEVEGRSKVVQARQTARYLADVHHALRNLTSEPVTALMVVIHARA